MGQDLKISQLPAAITPLSGDVLPIVNDGLTKKVTVDQINNFSRNYTQSNFLPLSGGDLTGTLRISSDLIVQGDLTVEGEISYLNTNIITNSAVVIDCDSNLDALRITQKGLGNVVLIEDSANPDFTPFVIRNDGRVGIGTNTPTQKLTVIGNINLTENLSAGGYVQAETGKFVNINNNDFIILDPDDRSFRIFLNEEEKVTLLSGGNLGIGTVLPSEKLTVIGNISATHVIYASGGNSQIWNHAYNNGVFAVSGTPHQIISTKTTTQPGANGFTLSFPTSAVFPGDVYIEGNLTTAGTATYINTHNLMVDDSLIYLAQGNEFNLVDIGFVAHFTDDPWGTQHTGLVRRANQASPGVWTLFSGLTSEPLTATNLNWDETSIVLDTLSANIATNNGTSDQWNSAYTVVETNSANWNNAFGILSSNTISGTLSVDNIELTNANLNFNQCLTWSQTKSLSSLSIVINGGQYKIPLLA
jgi:hypothetical protein